MLLVAAGGAGAVDTWESDSDIVSGLGDVGWLSSPTVFQNDSTWYLISGKNAGTFSGFNWTGSTWQSDSGIISGLGSIGSEAYPNVFQKDSTWYLISGQSIGTYRGFNWTGSAWQSDSGIISGLPAYGESAPTAFQKYITWYVIIGQHNGKFYGFNWTGTSWQSDTGIVSGLGDVGYHSTPTLFQNNSTWYLISGDRYGLFYGYHILPAPTAPTNLSHTKGTFWVNHTWDAGSGAIDTDSYNVSINETWYNGTTDTYYNNTLITWGDWSNATVYAYNTTYRLSAAPVSEDVQLPYPIPAVPTGTGSTWDYYWVNHTWTEGSSYGIWCGDTDSYNVSINGTWHNGTTDTYYNNTGLSPNGWSNASIYAFNNTAGINETHIYQNVQMITTITNTSDWSGWEGEMVYVDYDASSQGTPTFSCNRTDLFTDFDAATGRGNWTAVFGTYYVDFGVADAFGNTDNYTMAISVIYATPAVPTNLRYYFDDCFVTWTWDDTTQTTGYVDTDSYCVRINYTISGTDTTQWSNQTANNYTFSIICVDQLPTLMVWGYNNTLGCSTSAVSSNVTLPCINATDIAFDPANYSSGTLAGQQNWECVAGTSSVVQVHSGMMGRPWYEEIGSIYGETATNLTCPASTQKLFVSFWCQIYDEASQANSNVVTIRTGGSSPDNPYIFKFYNDMGGSRRVYNGTGDLVWSAYTHGNGIFWERYEFMYDRNDDTIEVWWYRNDGVLLGHAAGLPTIHSDSSLVYFSNTVNFVDCWLRGCIAAVDDIYVQSIDGGYGCYGECNESATTVLLKDGSGNLVTNAKVAIYDKTNDEYLQRWTTDEDGIISLLALLYNDTTFLFMVKTFDGIFTRDIYVNPGSNIVNLTIPIHYNVNIYPEDEHGTLLTGVFAGLAEYTPYNPLYFWGFSMGGRTTISIKYCSGFARCDIYAEKSGYADYNATALNWTSRSALVKDYRHSVVMEAEP